MKYVKSLLICSTIGLIGLMPPSNVSGEENLTRPHPFRNPSSALMLELSESGTDPSKIDFAKLPLLRGDHAVITRGNTKWHFRLHAYLAYVYDQYWCMWSHGPEVEDKATQHVRYATSRDGLHWEDPKVLAGPSRQDGFRYIARGFWLRNDGRLRALASHDEAGRYFGKNLELRSFLWNHEDSSWYPEGVVFDNTINNFPPKRLNSGEWMMTRRNAERSVSFLIGGTRRFDHWQVIPFSGYMLRSGARPEEPYWYILSGDTLIGLFRDNSRSGRLLRSFSADNGRSWSSPVRTNFPDATSKFNVLRTSKGYYVLINNANPEKRNPLCLSISYDGLVYTAMARLPVPAHIDGVTWESGSQNMEAGYESLQYPHAIEHDGHLLITFSRRKQTVEILKIALEELERLLIK